MDWSWLFFAALALFLAVYVLYEVLTRRLNRAGSPQALLVSAYRKSFERAERRRKAKRKSLLRQSHVLEDILRAQPEATAVRESLIKLYLAEAMVDPLKKHALEMLRHDPRNDLAFSTSVALASEDDFFADAREVFKAAINRSPNDLALVRRYANFLLGRLARALPAERESIMLEAESLIARLLQSSPEATEVLWSHAMLLRHQGRREEAAAELSKVASPQPSVLLQLGDVLAELGKRAEASEAYRRAVEAEAKSLNRVGPVSHVAHCKLGSLELRSGDVDAAAKHLREAIPTVPVVSFWRDGLDLELAEELLDRETALDVVREYVSVALAYKPDDERAAKLRQRLSTAG